MHSFSLELIFCVNPKYFLEAWDCWNIGLRFGFWLDIDFGGFGLDIGGCDIDLGRFHIDFGGV